MAADDDQNSILPSVVDGLTPAQRMLLLYGFKSRKFEKVKSFCKYVSERSPYEKGHLLTALTAMAQYYPGSNNLFLFYPHAVCSKYMFARFAGFTKYLFHASDEPLRGYLKRDDGKSIEQQHLTRFMPVIPMVLVNGIQAETGPNYNPLDIIANIRRLLNHQQLEPMVPWYRWFKGKILKDTATSYTTIGVVDVEKDGPNTLVISQLPIGTSVEEYTKFLEAALVGGYDKEPIIQKYYCYDDVFEVVMSPEQMDLARKEGFEIKLNLTTRLDTSNVCLLDQNGASMKYDSPEEILKQFCCLRLKCYEERKLALLDDIENALLQLEDQCRFIRKYLEGKIDLGKKPEELYADLKADKGYKALPKEPLVEDLAYLLSMRFYTAAYENQLRDERNQKIVLRDSIVATSPEGLWLQDLYALERQLNLIEANRYSVKELRIRSFDSDNEEAEDIILSDSCAIAFSIMEKESSEEQDEEDETEMLIEVQRTSDSDDDTEDEAQMAREWSLLGAAEIEEEETSAEDFSEFGSSSLEQDKEDEATMRNKKRILVQEDKEGETEMMSKRRKI